MCLYGALESPVPQDTAQRRRPFRKFQLAMNVIPEVFVTSRIFPPKKKTFLWRNLVCSFLTTLPVLVALVVNETPGPLQRNEIFRGLLGNSDRSNFCSVLFGIRFSHDWRFQPLVGIAWVSALGTSVWSCWILCTDVHGTSMLHTAICSTMFLSIF